MEFQNRLVELRIERGLSQEELSEKLYVSRQTISNWERGKTYPDINSLLLIATYFDVSLDSLLKGDVDVMKHQVDQVKFRKWLIIFGMSWFLFSVVFPTRYLFPVELVSGILFLLSLPMVYTLFQIFYILKNRELDTYADILDFLNVEKKIQKSWKNTLLGELWLGVLLMGLLYFLFLAGTIISALIFGS